MTNPQETVNRKYDIRQAKPDLHTVVREVTIGNLSRRNVVLAQVELVNEALSRLIELCYERIDGQLVNVDTLTHKLLIPVPWGRRGHSQWGLRASEAVVLRSILLYRAPVSMPSLFVYETTSKSWLIDNVTYGDESSAMAWLKRYGKVTPSEWQTAYSQWKSGRRGVLPSDVG